MQNLTPYQQAERLVKNNALLDIADLIELRDRKMKSQSLYYHKTDGGAEYLTDKYILNPDGSKEGVFENASIIVRIDGDITKDAEITIRKEV